MESPSSVQGLLALGESLPKRPRSEEVVFEEEDLGTGELLVIYDRIDVLMQENEDLREENNRMVRLIQAHENRLNKLQLALEATMRRVVSLERPE